MQKYYNPPQDWDFFRLLLSTLSFEKKKDGLWEKEELFQGFHFVLQVEEDVEENTCSFSLFFKQSNGEKSLIYSGFDDSIFKGLLSFQKEFHENKERLLKKLIDKYSENNEKLLKQWVEKCREKSKKENAKKDL